MNHQAGSAFVSNCTRLMVAPSIRFWHCSCKRPVTSHKFVNFWRIEESVFLVLTWGASIAKAVVGRTEQTVSPPDLRL